MAGNLTNQVRNHRGRHDRRRARHLSKKITVDVKGEMLELKATVNTMVDQLKLLRRRGDAASAREVGTDGKLARQAQVEGVPVRGKISPTRSTRWRET